MTRDEALALYRPVRASVRRILNAAISVCNQSDLMRAAKQLALWRDGKISMPEEDMAAEMLSDIALFEPNQRRRRAFDVFLGGKKRKVDAADFEMAQRMGKAFFSLFRCAARHEFAGIWLEDLLDDNRKIWLMDEGMEASAPIVGAFGMRIFDAGEFHVGFGIVAPSDDETTEFSIQGVTRNGRVPFRHSLAATLYGDALFGSGVISPELDEAFTHALAGLIDSRAGSGRAIVVQSTPQGSWKSYGVMRPSGRVISARGIPLHREKPTSLSASRARCVRFCRNGLPHDVGVLARRRRAPIHKNMI
jgi:hypothetical protein